ncbi:kinase-like domain-containing protein [Xylaria cf. heliscus]|nr:kinase-like domain-containing protein [Xylaria cf. heliscus]
MADADLIARVYPYCDWSRYAQTAIESSPLSMAPIHPRQEPKATQASRTTRGSTEPPDQYPPTLDQLPYLELRFSRAPRTSVGLIFGTDPSICDVVLPPIAGVSRRHFALTYKNDFEDRCYRLILRDLGSTYGTTVTYDERGGLRQRRFDWILDGFDAPNKTKQLIIKLDEALRFWVIVNHQRINCPEYVNNVKRFCKGTAAAESLVAALGLWSGPETKRPTQSHSPVRDRIILAQECIGSGAFGTVDRCWDVSTGMELACKQPVPGPYNLREWRKEIDIMKGIKHKHIVLLLDSTDKLPPRLYMEYMPLGNLEDQHQKSCFSRAECATILSQSVSALEYLHGLREPVAHRDLKPENILVQYRDPDHNPDGLRVKLSDFGLAKAGDLKTNCGSPIYQPPEVLNCPPWRNYTQSVDIWSLGVVILRFSYGLPFLDYRDGMEWCIKIVEKANTHDSETLINILRHMLVIEPSLRVSAAICSQWASDLCELLRSRTVAQMPDSYAARYGTILQYASIQYNPPYNEDNPKTIESGRLERPGRAYVGNQGVNAPPPEPVEEHPIVRSVHRNSGGLIFVYIRQKRVSMRISDHCLNISEMMSAASLDKNVCEKRLDEFRRRATVFEENGCFWAPFEDGMLFSRKLGLQEDMKELFSYGPQSPQNRKTEKCQILEWDGFKIAYVPSTRKVNATHLLKLGALDRQKLRPYFNKHPEVKGEVIRGRDMGYDIQGTYITFDDALNFCDAFNLSQGPIHQLLSILVESGDPGPATGHEPPYTNHAGYSINASQRLEPATNQRIGLIGVAPPPSLHDRLRDDNYRPGETGEGSHYSRYTEQTYSNGSYLAPQNVSYKQLLDK